MAIIDYKQAFNLLKSDQIVALPTDTVFGVAASLNSNLAVEKIYNLKERPKDKPLALLISEEDILKNLVTEIKKEHLLLIRKFWPGALTLIFKKSNKISDLITSGKNTVGIRMPNHQEILNLIGNLGGVLVATSVNKSGFGSLNSVEEINENFPGLAVVNDGFGVLKIESTVVDLSGNKPVILREGYIKKAQIEEIIGPID